MTKQAVIYLLVLLAGLAGGTGIGYFMTQSKIDAANVAAGELAAQLQEQQTQSEADLKAATDKASRMEGELTRSRNDVMRKNTELLRAQTDVAKLKTVLEQMLGRTDTAGGTASAQPGTAPQTSTTVAPGTPARTAPSPSTTTTTPPGTREYTVKDGDSLWKIAANELGNGIRFKDIIAVNSGMTENTPLTVGMKIKLPPR